MKPLSATEAVARIARALQNRNIPRKHKKARIGIGAEFCNRIGLIAKLRAAVKRVRHKTQFCKAIHELQMPQRARNHVNA